MHHAAIDELAKALEPEFVLAGRQGNSAQFGLQRQVVVHILRQERLFQPEDIGFFELGDHALCLLE